MLSVIIVVSSISYSSSTVNSLSIPSPDEEIKFSLKFSLKKIWRRSPFISWRMKGGPLPYPQLPVLCTLLHSTASRHRLPWWRQQSAAAAANHRDSVRRVTRHGVCSSLPPNPHPTLHVCKGKTVANCVSLWACKMLLTHKHTQRLRLATCSPSLFTDWNKLNFTYFMTAHVSFV